jgi:hypothetical protein
VNHCSLLLSPHKIVTVASNMVLAVLVGHDDENVVAVDCHH